MFQDLLKMGAKRRRKTLGRRYVNIVVKLAQNSFLCVKLGVHIQVGFLAIRCRRAVHPSPLVARLRRRSSLLLKTGDARDPKERVTDKGYYCTCRVLGLKLSQTIP